MMLLPRIKYLLAALLLWSGVAHALEYRSVLETGTIFYAAPATSSNKLFVASQFYPVEVVDQQGEWARVRDADGQLAWVQSARLSPKRHVLIAAARTVLRQSALDSAPALLTLDRDVVLELVEAPSSMWAKVRHGGKTVGFVRVQDIWGI